MKSYFILILVLIIFIASFSFACTTTVISGKATQDGRPLLYKHRDTGEAQNKVMYFDDGEYDYIGLVNSKDIEGVEVWAGCNSTGFAIMNSATYNQNLSDTTKLKDREGFVMKQALQQCANLKDFEDLLKRLPKPLGVDANFGVIDASGGAAYYETNNYKFTKYDVNDPAVAPYGYIIRTNYAFTGERHEDYGVIRYQTATEMFEQAYASNSLSHKFLLQDVSRSLKHSLTKTNLREQIPTTEDSKTFVNFKDFIPRYYSAATTCIQGVKKDENPELSTMWTILGFQLSSVAIPTWIAGGKEMPKILMVDSTGTAPLCDKAVTLKKKIFPLNRGSYKDYIDLSKVMNKDNSGILQQLIPMENSILHETNIKMSNWLIEEPEKENIQVYYHWLDEIVLKSYQDLFGI
jgi:acyl-CoA:6-aminopenicillanic acid acyl transferase